MKKLFPFLPLSLLLVSCDVGGVRGNGHITTEQRPIGNFVNLQTGGAFEVEWRPGSPSLSITTDKNLLSHITSQVDHNDVLRLHSDDSLRPHHGIKVVVTSSALEAARLNGASRLEAHDLSGAKFYVETNGATKIIPDGKVTDLIAIMSGASRFDGENLHATNGNLEINGAGKALVDVTDSLKVSIAGAGKVEYVNPPRSLEKSIAGAGKIGPRD